MDDGHRGQSQNRTSQLPARVSSSEYNREIEHVAGQVTQAGTPTLLDFLEHAGEKLGAEHAMLVRCTSDTDVDIELEWSAQGVDVPDFDFRSFLARRLSQARTAVGQIAPLAEGSGLSARTIMIHRLAFSPGHDNWDRAIVFAGRRFAPTEQSSRAFLTFDFTVAKALVINLLEFEEHDGASTAFGTAFPLLGEMRLYDVLRHQIGPEIEVVCSSATATVRNVPLRGLTPALSAHRAAETCLSCMAIGLPDRVYLDRPVGKDFRNGVTYEFNILLNELAVHARRLCVRTLLGGVTAEVSIPMGWWWTDDPLEAKLTPEQAREVVGHLEQEQGNGSVVDAHVYTAIWPESPLRRTAHIVRALKGETAIMEYFIDAVDGSLLRKRGGIRDLS